LQENVKMTFTLNVNGSSVSVDAPAATPLVWVIREHLKLTGTKFGCGAVETACRPFPDDRLIGPGPRRHKMMHWREVSCAQDAAISQKTLQFSKSTMRRGSLCLSPAD
jgi:hypothetical protein